MPFISVNVTGQVTPAQKEQIKTQLGQLITILPGKDEGGLMVDISDNHSLYFGGKEKESCAFLDIRLYKESPLAEKTEFVKAVCEALHETLGIDKGDVYLNFIELANWGCGGSII